VKRLQLIKSLRKKIREEELLKQLEMV